MKSNNNMLGVVCYVSILFAIKSTKVHQKMRKQPTNVANSGKGVKLTLKLDCIHYVLEQTVHAKTNENDLSTQRILFLCAWKTLMPYTCNYIHVNTITAQ